MNTPLRTIALLATIAVLAAAPDADADSLRNLEVGESMPDFALTTVDGATIRSTDLRGKAYVLVFLSAEQRSSESAATAAHAVREALRGEDFTLIFVTADVAETAYFRAWRDRAQVHEPLALDFDRTLYGQLGLIVLPTTVVADRQHQLAHVMSSYKSDYEHVLRTYARHALGLINDEEVTRALEYTAFQRGLPSQKVERHRAAARLLRENGLLTDAEKELRAALEIAPDDADARLDLAAVKVGQGEIDESLVIVEGVLADDPRHRRAKLVYGVVLFRADRLPEAKRVLGEALLLNPDPIQTHYYLGLIAEREGDSERALQHYKESLSRLIEKRPL